RKSAPLGEPKPQPNPAQIERGETSGKRQDEQHAFPENDGLVRRKTREASDIESAEGAETEGEREAATKRGRVS
ncbi:MAG TPA: hypothetical protein VIA80_13310, partial [Hyphomonadaceae bacterium]